MPMGRQYAVILSQVPFSTIKLDTNCQPSTLLIYAVREDYGGKVNVALWVIFDAKTGNCCIVGTI
jgi:hypothetical protein